MKLLNKTGVALAIISIIGLSGCSQKQTYTHVDKVEIISSLDFTKYQKEDFLITPGEYGNDYTAMGIFTFTIYPEANYIETVIKNKKGKNIKSGKWVSNNLSSQEVLDLAYQTALKKGANAITHFKVKGKAQSHYDGMNNFVIGGLAMSGLLIKRTK